MACPQLYDLIQHRLDGTRAADERHLAECAECRAWLAAVERLEEGLRQCPAPVPPAGLANRIVAGALRQHRRRLAVRRLAPLAVAAGLLVAVLAGYTGVFAPPAQRVTVQTVRVNTPPTRPADVPLNRNVEEAGSALVALLSRTADRAMAQGRGLFPADVPVPALPETTHWQAPLERPVESLRAAGQGVSSGLEPVTHSARRAVNFFLQEIPTREPRPAKRG